MTGMVGSVTRQRYDELVKLGRDWVETMSSVQWQLGDAAMEIEPMRSYGGTNPSGSEELFTVSEAIRMFAEDIGLAYTTIRDYRWVASRWPKEHRRADVSHAIHKTLASLPDGQERFEAVDNPPPHPRGGPARWTHDSAKRIVGWKVDTPESVQEKVDAIHDLAADDQVAARVATDFLRRPAVASKAMADGTARHAGNEAQFDQFRQQLSSTGRRKPPRSWTSCGAWSTAPSSWTWSRSARSSPSPPGGSCRTCAVSPTTTPNARRSCGALRGCGRRRTGSRTRSPAARSTWTSSFRSC